MNHYTQYTEANPSDDFPSTAIAGRQHPAQVSRRDDWALTPLARQRVATLEREAPRTVALALEAGVQIEYVGIAPLLDGHHVFARGDSSWVVGPAQSNDAALIPRQQARALIQLSKSSISFPLVYIAHELAQGRVPGSSAPVGRMTPVSRSTAEDLVGAVPPPGTVVELGERLSLRARQVFAGMKIAAGAVGAVAAAPFVLGATALAGLATLDPILFGVIPAVSSDAGQPAAWFVLARWDW